MANLMEVTNKTKQQMAKEKIGKTWERNGISVKLIKKNRSHLTFLVIEKGMTYTNKLY